MIPAAPSLFTHIRQLYPRSLAARDFADCADYLKFADGNADVAPMIHGKIYLLAVLAGLTLICAARAQDVTVVPPKGSGPPTAFSTSNDSLPPQFLPPNGKSNEYVRYGFAPDQEKICPADNAFNDGVEKIPGGIFAPKYYGSIGGMALRRNSLYSEQVASIAPALGFTSPALVDLQSVPTNFNLGIRGDVGVVVGPGALELSGFYIFNANSSFTATPTTDATGPITVYFAHFPAPAGFNPALWTDASQLGMHYSLATGNVELNYRMPIFAGLDFLAGLRYFNQNESLSLSTLAPLGTTDYAFTVHSQIIGPQLGVDWEQFLIPQFCSISALAKGAVGPNFFSVSHSLTEGNGVNGPGGSANETQISGIIEIGAFASIWFHERLKLRVGYEALWVLNVAEAQQQINFNTNLPLGSQQYHGSIFYQGPVVELQFAF